MENSNAFVSVDNQVNDKKPPPRVCPRCNSDNTKFCYYNNYSVSQPRYNCKNCRRYWTHGGTLRNIPIGGSARKPKRTRNDQSSISQTVSVEIQQVNHHQPFLHVQETNGFVGSFGGSSSTAIAVRNHYGSFPGIHGDTALPIQSYSPMDRLDTHVGSFQQDYYNVGSNILTANPLMNQTAGGSAVISSNFGYNNQEEGQNNLNQSFNNNVNLNYNANYSRNRGSIGTDHMNNNNNHTRSNCIFRSSYHLEKHDP